MGFTPKQLGHLVIKVRDLDRAEDFYTRVMGLTVMNRRPGHMVFMSANIDLSHELAIAKVDDSAPGPQESGEGLAHMAWQMSLRRPEGAISSLQGEPYSNHSYHRTPLLHGRLPSGPR